MSTRTAAVIAAAVAVVAVLPIGMALAERSPGGSRAASTASTLRQRSLCGLDTYWQSITSPAAKARVAQARIASGRESVGLTAVDVKEQMQRATGLIKSCLTGRAQELQLKNTAMVLAASIRHAAPRESSGASAAGTPVIADVYTGGGLDNYTVLAETVTGGTAHLTAQGVGWSDDTVYFADGTSEDEPSRGMVRYEIDMVLVDGIWMVSDDEPDVEG
jgi:hypothetical protein